MKKKHPPISGTAFIILTGLISVASAAPITINNSSFETGNLDGWSSSGQAAAINWNGTPPGGGTYNAFLSSVGGWGLIWQNVGTLQANTDYTLSFYGAAAYWQPSAPLLANFTAYNTNSNTGITLVQQTLTVTANGTSSDWTQYSISLPASVSGENFSSWIGTDLSIYFGTANGDPVVVDLVSLDAVVVPEPTATSYLVASLIVFLCLGVTMRRSRWIVSGSESQ
jgi:hypothetical protein